MKHPSKKFFLCSIHAHWAEKLFVLTILFSTNFFDIHKQNMVCYLFTPPRNREEDIFSLQFVCVCVCLSVCVSGISSEQNSSRKDALIWTRFSLNDCLLLWLEPYWNGWPWVKGQGHSDSISIFLYNPLLTSSNVYLSSLMSDQTEIWYDA